MPMYEPQQLALNHNTWRMMTEWCSLQEKHDAKAFL